MSRKQTVQVSAAAMLVAVASTFFLASTQSARVPASPDRVIVLTAKGYAFHEPGDPSGDDNPPLHLKAGERVRVVVRNEEEGDVEHNFKIPGLAAQCSKKIPRGEEGMVEFTVPKDGVYTYTCCSHPGMGGAVEIEGGAPGTAVANPQEEEHP